MPIRISSSMRRNSVPTGGRISRVTTSIASGAGKPALTPRTIRSSASGKTSRKRRWYRLCESRSSSPGTPTAAAPPKAIASAGRNCAAAAAEPIATAAVIPEAVRRASPMRLPIAARARSRCLDSAAGNALRCGNGLRSDTSGLSGFEAALIRAFKWSSRLALRRSVRTVQRSAPPSRTVVPRTESRICSSNSDSADAEGVEQLSVEAEARCASNEIGTRSGGLERPFDLAVVLLAAVLEGEELPGCDDITFHACDLDDALDAPDTVPHALDVHDQVESAGEVHADRLERQVEVRHHDHVFDAVKRIARRVGVNRRHRPVVPRIHRLQHVERHGAADFANDDAVRAHAQSIAEELALCDLADAFDVGRARLHLHHMRLLKTELDRVFDRDYAFVTVDVLRDRV